MSFYFFMFISSTWSIVIGCKDTFNQFKWVDTPAVCNLSLSNFIPHTLNVLTYSQCKGQFNNYVSQKIHWLGDPPTSGSPKWAFSAQWVPSPLRTWFITKRGDPIAGSSYRIREAFEWWVTLPMVCGVSDGTQWSSETELLYDSRRQIVTWRRRMREYLNCVSIACYRHSVFNLIRGNFKTSLLTKKLRQL